MVQAQPILQSKDGCKILDIIDSLRSQGISQYVDLPQIIVCGDQSSGKSSVLEAISGLTFPAKDTLCTRFATELVLRRSLDEHDEGFKVSIIPGSERSDEDRKKLAKFNPDLRERELGAVIEQATDAMGLSGTDEAFCTDVLRVEASSPQHPHLTLVDLPGLFLAGNKDQSVEDAKLIESLVLSYMEQPRSIIFAVVSAKSEFALQQVTQRAREVDPEGHRTLGLITKPDTLDEGSESERAYLELAQNKDVHFRLGWHVIRNRDFNTRHSTNAERDMAETAFFSQGVWKHLNPAQVGVDALRVRLSKVLQDQIMTHLPRVLDDIQSGVSECNAILDKLGAMRVSPDDQRRYLLRLSQAFISLVKASIEGDYSDRSFFGDSTTSSGYEKRLRARVQNTLSKFSQVMRLTGHAKTIVEMEKNASEASQPVKITRSQYVEKVNVMLQRNRGRELPGTFNPLIVGEMFSDQCKPWKGIVKTCINTVFHSVRSTLSAALKHVADDETAARLTIDLLNPSMTDLESSVEEKLAELLEPHIRGHPITYNHYLTDNIQKVQSARHRAKARMAFDAHVDFTSTASLEIVPVDLYLAVMAATAPDMKNYASMTAIDAMEAYYKVAIKKFIDDISVLAVEQCLIQRLPHIFSSDFVCDLSDEEIRRLAEENPKIVAERSRVTEKQMVLVEGLTQLTRLSKGLSASVSSRTL